MSTMGAQTQRDHGDEQDGVIVTPEQEAELKGRIAATDEDLRAGRAITWEQFLGGQVRER